MTARRSVGSGLWQTRPRCSDNPRREAVRGAGGRRAGRFGVLRHRGRPDRVHPHRDRRRLRGAGRRLGPGPRCARRRPRRRASQGGRRGARSSGAGSTGTRTTRTSWSSRPGAPSSPQARAQGGRVLCRAAARMPPPLHRFRPVLGGIPRSPCPASRAGPRVRARRPQVAVSTN